MINRHPIWLVIVSNITTRLTTRKSGDCFAVNLTVVLVILALALVAANKPSKDGGKSHDAAHKNCVSH
jgi:hypothetical protein